MAHIMMMMERRTAEPPENALPAGAVRCRLCGNVWMPRVAWRPKSCPACKRYDWDQPRNLAKGYNRAGTRERPGMAGGGAT